MKRLCAWCGKKLSGRGDEISHSICGPCFGAMFQPQFDFVERLPRTEESVRHSGRRRGSPSVQPGPLVQEDFVFAEGKVALLSSIPSCSHSE